MNDEFEKWRRETNEKIRLIDSLINDLVALKNSYLMASFPGGLGKRKKVSDWRPVIWDGELSPSQMRKRANRPWRDDE